jgi:hypothetical protein
VSFIKELQERVERIEAQEKEHALTLIEILSSAAFFGGLKQANCPYARDGSLRRAGTCGSGSHS